MPIDRLANNDARQRRALQQLQDGECGCGDHDGGSGAWKLLYVNTTSGDAVANTTNQLGPGANIDVSLIANYFTAGTAVRITILGKHSTTSTPTLQVRLKFNDSTIIDLGAITCGSGVANEQFVLQVLVVCRREGNTGQLNVHLLDGQLNGRRLAAKTTVAFATGGAAKIRPTLQWGTASSSNTARIEMLMVEGL